MKIIGVTDEEIVAMTNLLECMSRGVNEDSNFIFIGSMNDADFNAIISLIKKMNNIE